MNESNRNRSDGERGFGCLFLLLLLGIGYVFNMADGCKRERAQASIKEDYSSQPSEEGVFSTSGGWNLKQPVRHFEVRNGVGYLVLQNGREIKLKRISRGHYEGGDRKYTYKAIQMGTGYNIFED